jgi:hypothetical protein
MSSSDITGCFSPVVVITDNFLSNLVQVPIISPEIYKNSTIIYIVFAIFIFTFLTNTITLLLKHCRYLVENISRTLVMNLFLSNLCWIIFILVVSLTSGLSRISSLFSSLGCCFEVFSFLYLYKIGRRNINPYTLLYDHSTCKLMNNYERIFLKIFTNLLIFFFFNLFILNLFIHNETMALLNLYISILPKLFVKVSSSLSLNVVRNRDFLGIFFYSLLQISICIISVYNCLSVLIYSKVIIILLSLQQIVFITTLIVFGNKQKLDEDFTEENYVEVRDFI